VPTEITFYKEKEEEPKSELKKIRKFLSEKVQLIESYRYRNSYSYGSLSKPRFELDESALKRAQPFFTIPTGIIILFTIVSSIVFPMFSVSGILVQYFLSIIMTGLSCLAISLISLGIVNSIRYIVDGDPWAENEFFNKLYNFLMYPISTVKELSDFKKRKEKYKQDLAELENKKEREQAKRKQILNMHDLAYGEFSEEVFEGITLKMVKEIINKDME